MVTPLPKSLTREAVEVFDTETQVLLAYLFGSYAKRNHTASSDIDVLVVVGEEDPDTYKKIRMPRLELLMYTTNEYIEMKKKHPKTIEKLLEKTVKLI